MKIILLFHVDGDGDTTVFILLDITIALLTVSFVILDSTTLFALLVIEPILPVWLFVVSILNHSLLSICLLTMS